MNTASNITIHHLMVNNGHKTEVPFTTFSDGTESCVIPKNFFPSSKSHAFLSVPVEISVAIQNATVDLFRVALVKDALDRLGITVVTLDIPYFPQARADRVFQQGQPLPLKVATRFINSLGFTKVLIEDPHSDVTSALLDNVTIVDQVSCTLPFTYIRRLTSAIATTLCAPDLGAAKKMFDVAKRFTGGEYIQAIKIRDVRTGDIVKSEIIGRVTAKHVTIIDDIADGGASFKYLARELKLQGVQKVALVVTHGIFSKGLDVLAPEIDEVFVGNIVGEYVTSKDLDNFNSKGEK